ncbi:MAG: PPC domain-containing protein [Butyrivibrio sp.]|nr:PPC domain-containing protein [Butyrivibrio sp.]
MKLTKRIVSFLLVFALVMGICQFEAPMRASAEETVVNLVANDSFVDGSLPYGAGQNLYKVTVPANGFLKVSVQGDVLGFDVNLFNSDMSVQYRDSFIAGGTTYSATVALLAGTCMIQVKQTGGSAQTYKIRASFEAAGNNETEPNNDFSKAMTLAEKQTVTGFICTDDTRDFYQFSIPSDTNVRINYTSMIRGTFALLDSEYNELEKNEPYGSKEEPKTEKIEKKLSAGTYYIRVEKGYSDGLYTLSWTSYVEKSKTLKKVSFENVSAKKKKITVKWKKQKDAKKYEIQLATDKKFTKNLVVKTVGGKKKSLTVKNNKKGKVYIRIRGIDSKGAVGAWSKVKTVKVK